MATIKNQSQKIVPCLWFNDNAEEAVKYYNSIFKNSKILKVSRYGEGTRMPKGTVLTIRFKIEGQEFLALNGGPYFNFTEAVSFVVNCKTQKEIDFYWEKLSKGGDKLECGWLKDKFGLSWQVVPFKMNEWMTDKNAEKSSRVLQAILKMKKLDEKALQLAYDGTEKFNEDFLTTIAAPARRALEGAGFTSLEKLSKVTESHILRLHGIGPGSIPKLRNALKSKKLAFLKE
jgi:predicted 3-demethylubiquinone-9 3-methyltransferase (glyoxalase superfamily)